MNQPSPCTDTNFNRCYNMRESERMISYDSKWIVTMIVMLTAEWKRKVLPVA
jgi:hypothetical protein